MRRIEFDAINNRYIFRGNVFFLAFSAVTLFMATSGIRMIFGSLPLEDGYTGGDIFGIIFLSVWTALVLTGLFIGLTNATKKVIISTEGVTCKTLFSKREYLWSEIEDWGISYSGYTRGEGNTYDFYFSKNQQRAKNECRKRLKGKMIKTFVFESEYDRVAEDVIPFCSSRTFIQPFIGVNKYHFWG